MPLIKAVILNDFGGPDVLQIKSIACPIPDNDEVLIRVVAAGINRPDVMQRKGLYPPPPGATDIPGLECSGYIAEVGKNVTKWKRGDKVCALLNGGGYAEYATANSGHCLLIPTTLDFITAAGLPETFFTVWSNIFDRGNFKKNETILIHGGSSGIGTTAIQMAKAFGATVITTSGTDKKCEFCKFLGADHVINYKSQDFVEIIKYITNGSGVNIILDMVAGDYLDKNIKSLNTEGRLIIIAVQKGPKVSLDILPVMLKRLTITGSTLRPRDVAFKSAIAEQLNQKIWPLIESNTIKQIIDKVFTFDDVIKAHDYFDKGDHMGKVILQMNEQ